MPKRKGVYRLGRLDLFLMVKGSFEDDLLDAVRSVSITTLIEGELASVRTSFESAA